MAKSKFKRLIKRSYLQMIKNSVRTKMFRNLFVVDEKGRKIDALRNGDVACAFFVSGILKIFSLITWPHATCDSTVRDMLENGWRRTKKLKPGYVLFWERNKNGRKHLGFYIGNNKAISNSSKKGYPVIHHFTYGKNKNNQPKRKIEGIFTHKDIA